MCRERGCPRARWRLARPRPPHDEIYPTDEFARCFPHGGVSLDHVALEPVTGSSKRCSNSSYGAACHVPLSPERCAAWLRHGHSCYTPCSRLCTCGVSVGCDGMSHVLALRCCVSRLSWLVRAYAAQRTHIRRPFCGRLPRVREVSAGVTRWRDCLSRQPRASVLRPGLYTARYPTMYRLVV